MAPEIQSDEKLEQLHKRIAHWRSTRRKQGPMPEELWHEAASLARTHGVSSVAREFGLGYDALQQRVRAKGGSSSGAAYTSANRFVELSSIQLGSAPAASGATVEVVGGDGMKLTIRLPPGSPLDVVGLIATMRSRRS